MSSRLSECPNWAACFNTAARTHRAHHDLEEMLGTVCGAGFELTDLQTPPNETSAIMGAVRAEVATRLIVAQSELADRLAEVSACLIPDHCPQRIALAAIRNKNG